MHAVRVLYSSCTHATHSLLTLLAHACTHARKYAYVHAYNAGTPQAAACMIGKNREIIAGQSVVPWLPPMGVVTQGLGGWLRSSAHSHVYSASGGGLPVTPISLLTAKRTLRSASRLLCTVPLSNTNAALVRRRLAVEHRVVRAVG